MTTTMMNTLSEEAIQELEAQIPALAAIATGLAYERAKQAGYTVVLSKGGFIVAEDADGSERILGLSKPLRKVIAGVPFSIGPSSR